MRLSVRAKLISGFTLILVIVAIAGWRGILGMRDINRELNSIYTDQFKPARLISNANIALIAWNRAVLNHVLAENTERMGKYEQIMLEQKIIVEEHLQKLSEWKYLSKRGKELVHELVKDFQLADPIRDRIVALSRGGKLKEAHHLVRTEMRSVIDEIDLHMTEFVKLQEMQLEQTMMVTDERYQQSFVRILLIVGAALILTLIVSWYLSSRILTSVNELVQGAKSAAKGDFEWAKVTIKSKDEFEYLGEVFNQMLNDIQQSVIQIKQAEEAQKRTSAELEKTNKELEAFAYSVSHDLRAPLRAIDGFAQMLVEDHGDELVTDGQRQIRVIQSSTRTMGRLIDGLLKFSRLGRKGLHISKINMMQLIEEVYKQLKQSKPELKVELTVSELPHANGDPTLIREVLTNLISNAVKFSKTSDSAIVEISGTTNETENVYIVKDNGVGFDMKYADKLFQVFQRLHSTAEFEGSGIGLALVQPIIHRHGGRVYAESKVNEGATFYFTLPKEKETENGLFKSD